MHCNFFIMPLEYPHVSYYYRNLLEIVEQSGLELPMCMKLLMVVRILPSGQNPVPENFL